MNDVSSKPTLGPAVFNKHNGGPYHGNITVYRGKNEIGVQQVRTVAVVLPYASADENDANAALIAEAFNVHHETGLTPQQLRKQRDELLAALRNLTMEVMSVWSIGPASEALMREAISNTNYNCVQRRIDEARATIAKVEQSK